jgi:2-C-methyl-D-erythritol 4-phosphate cytidylyltransferase
MANLQEYKMTTQARYFGLIPAAGVGARMAGTTPKQYLNLAGKPMLRHALDAFLDCPLIAHTFVVVSPEDSQIDALLPLSIPGVTLLRCGGASRMASVLNALQALRGEVGLDDWILVHDAARPGLTSDLIEKLIAGVGDDPVGGLLALPVVDTVKRAGPVGIATVARDGLWLAQTPQMFRYRLLARALNAAPDAGAITDDASAIEALGLVPRLIEGHPCNFKVTLPLDIGIAEMYLANNLVTNKRQPQLQPQLQPDREQPA